MAPGLRTRGLVRSWRVRGVASGVVGDASRVVRSCVGGRNLTAGSGWGGRRPRTRRRRPSGSRPTRTAASRHAPPCSTLAPPSLPCSTPLHPLHAPPDPPLALAWRRCIFVRSMQARPPWRSLEIPGEPLHTHTHGRALHPLLHRGMQARSPCFTLPPLLHTASHPARPPRSTSVSCAAPLHLCVYLSRAWRRCVFVRSMQARPPCSTLLHPGEPLLPPPLPLLHVDIIWLAARTAVAGCAHGPEGRVCAAGG